MFSDGHIYFYQDMQVLCLTKKSLSSYNVDG